MTHKAKSELKRLAKIVVDARNFNVAHDSITAEERLARNIWSMK